MRSVSPGSRSRPKRPRRPFDDLAEAGAEHGIQGDLLVALRGALEQLEVVEEVRAHGGENHDRAEGFGAGVQQQPQGSSGFRSLGRAEHLLQLVEDEQDRAFGGVVGIAKFAAELRAGHRAARPSRMSSMSVRLTSILEGLLQRQREPLQALAAREGRHDHPGGTIVLARVLQLRQHPGAHQRRLAAAGRAEQHDETLGVALSAPVQDVDDLGRSRRPVRRKWRRPSR